MIIHFGKNPVSGGRPPRESIMIRTDVAVTGDLFHR